MKTQTVSTRRGAIFGSVQSGHVRTCADELALDRMADHNETFDGERDRQPHGAVRARVDDHYEVRP